MRRVKAVLATLHHREPSGFDAAWFDQLTPAVLASVEGFANAAISNCDGNAVGFVPTAAVGLTEPNVPSPTELRD